MKTEQSPEKLLWNEGINRTADALVLNAAKTHILLIKRRNGQWALPGGFTDKTDASAHEASLRELFEEAGISPQDTGTRVFHGVVTDPRNDDDRWIETEAYLFRAPPDALPIAGDDAMDAAFWPLSELPDLYASHRSIIERAIDTEQSLEIISDLQNDTATLRSVTGGHMEYEKCIIDTGTAVHFAKIHTAERYTDAKKAERSLDYLKKEAALLHHLRVETYAHVPEYSAFDNDALIMESLLPENGWHWRVPNDDANAYITDVLDSFNSLSSVPVPSDSFPIETSIESFRREGWNALYKGDSDLVHLANTFLPRLNKKTKPAAAELVLAIDALYHEWIQPHCLDDYVLCHHDARQSNIAWHPEEGVKIVDWSWAGFGPKNADATNFLIDMHKSGHDITPYLDRVNPHHCLTLIGFLLAHSTWPIRGNDDSVRFQQFVSAVSAYEVYKTVTG